MSELVNLAMEALREKLGELKPSEIYMLEQVEKGEPADYRIGDKEKDDPANSKEWGEERIIKAGVIEWICTNKNATAVISTRGLNVFGAKITERIRLLYAMIDFPLMFDYCCIPSGFNFAHAHLGHLSLKKSLIAHHGDPNNMAFIGDGLTVAGSFNIDGGAKIEGETRLIKAKIGGVLNCTGSTFINPGKVAFHGDGLLVNGPIFMGNGTKFEGEMCLVGAEIGGDIIATGASFNNPFDKAFSGDGLILKGNLVFNDGATFNGEIRLPGAVIGGQVSFEKGNFINNGGMALQLQFIKVKEQLFLTEIANTKGDIDLTDASAGIIVDDESYWDIGLTIHLDGFKFGRIHSNDSKLLTAESRLKWLALQSKKRFHPQTYDQLAKAFRNMGQDGDARKVLIAKQIERRKHLGVFNRSLSFLLHLTTGYGYQMWRALLFAAAFIMIGWLVFDGAYEAGRFNSTKFNYSSSEKSIAYIKEKLNYPSFNSFVYSIDAFLPIVDLHQESHWLPRSNDADARWIWMYLWFHILMGWLLTTLVVASITGIVRRE
jgi:hypothetical protein